MEQDDEPAMEKMKKHTTRRKRRRAVAKLKFGENAVRAHRRQAGRTGRVQAKRTPGKGYRYSSSRPNPPGPTGMNLGPQ